MRQSRNIMNPGYIFSLLLCTVGHFYSSVANAEVTFKGAGPKYKSWTLSRGNLNFKWPHPLRVLHGQVTMTRGMVKLDPERPGDGIELTLEGQRDKITFEESVGRRVSSSFPNKPWKYISVAADWLGKFEGGFKVNFVGWFDSAEAQHPLSFVSVCQADDFTLKCSLGGIQDIALLNWSPPKLLWLPLNPKIAYTGEFLFNSRTAD